MKKMLSLVAFLFCTAFLGAEPEPAKPIDLTGIYELHGVEKFEDGDVPYAGMVILKKEGEGYVAQWCMGPGANIVGIAAIDDGFLVCAWQAQSRLGVTRYKIDDCGKKLSGKWMAVPLLNWHEETLTYKLPFPKKKELTQTQNKPIPSKESKMQKPELGKRSPHWPAVRAAHLKSHPTCAACGGHENCEVHHIKPFHLHPALELDPTNFITLCESQQHHCHLAVGHLFDWHSWNETVVHNAALMLYMIQHRPSDAQSAA